MISFSFSGKKRYAERWRKNTVITSRAVRAFFFGTVTWRWVATEDKQQLRTSAACYVMLIHSTNFDRNGRENHMIVHALPCDTTCFYKVMLSAVILAGNAGSESLLVWDRRLAPNGLNGNPCMAPRFIRVPAPVGYYQSTYYSYMICLIHHSGHT